MARTKKTAITAEAQVEQRSLENPSVPLSAAYDYLALSSRQAGVSVNRVSIHQIPVLRRCVNIISDRIAKCGVDVYKQSDHGPVIDVEHAAHWLLSRKPGLGFTPFEFVKQVVSERCIFGNSFWAIRRDTKYNPLEFVHLDPEYTGLTVVDSELWYITHINNVEVKFPADDVLHFKNLCDATGLMGVSPLMYCQQALGLSLAILKYETFQFQNQCKPSVILTLPPALANDPLKRQNFRKTFEQMQTGIEAAGRVAIFDAGIQTTVIDQSNQATQLVELNEKQERAICQLMGLDPSAVGLDVATSHNSLEQKEATLLENLDGPMTAIEQEFEEKLLRFSELNNDTHQILFNRADFLKTDVQTQLEMDISELTIGAMSWEEYRIKRNKPVTKKGLWFHASNVVPFDINDPLPKPEPVEQPKAVEQQQEPDEPKQEQKQEDKQARNLAGKLLEKTSQRIVKRLKKAVESKAEKETLNEIADSLVADHRSVIIDAIDCLPDCKEITHDILNDLQLELRSIGKEDIHKIDWNRFGRKINEHA